MTRTSKEGQNPVIGILTFKNKLIQRKFDSEVIWDEVNSGIEVRNRDTIRTGDFSDALLTLKKKYAAQGDTANFSISISREDLANIAGTATESLIRTLSDFKAEKLIEIKEGKISILEEKKLANLFN